MITDHKLCVHPKEIDSLPNHAASSQIWHFCSGSAPALTSKHNSHWNCNADADTIYALLIDIDAYFISRPFLPSFYFQEVSSSITSFLLQTEFHSTDESPTQFYERLLERTLLMERPGEKLLVERSFFLRIIQAYL